MAGSKMHKCPTCGQDIANSAKVCPNCGAKQKGGKLKIILIVIAVLIVIGAASGGGSKKPKKVESSDSSSTVSQEATNQEEAKTEEPKQEEAKTEEPKQEEAKTEEPKQEEEKTFTIGDTADFDGVQIQVQNAMISQGDGQFIKPDDGKVFLGVIVSIVNNSNKDISISSVMNFEAYCDDFALQQDLIGYQCPEWDGYDQVDNKVAAGKRLGGVVCYQVPADFNKFDLSINPDFWSSRKVDFTFTHDQCN